MIDRTAALFRGLDAPRAVPAPARMRLVSALEVAALPPTAENLRAILDRPKRMPVDARTRIESLLIGEDDADVAARMQGIDAPVEMTPLARMRLERRLAAEQRRREARVWQMTGAAAAAVLVLIAAVVLARPGARVPGTDGGRTPEALPPPIVKTEPPVRPTPKDRVLGVREVRIPTKSRTSTKTQPNAGAPVVDVVFGEPAQGSQPGDIGAQGRRGAPGLTPDARTSGGLPLLDPVTALVSKVLSVLQGQLTLDDLLDISKGNQPPPTVPPPAAPAPPKRSRARTTRTPARTAAAPAAPAQPAAPKQQSSGLTAITDAVDGIVRELVDVSILSPEPLSGVSLLGS